jgi:sec-independent protein translocase protein TatC
VDPYNQSQLTFWEHLEELRQTLLRCFLVVFIGVLIAFIFHEPLFNLATSPLQKLSNFEGLSFSSHTLEKIEKKRLTNTSSKPQTINLPKNATITSTTPFNASKEITILPQESIEFEIPSPQNALYILSPIDGMLMSLKLSFWTGILCSSPIWCYFIVQFIAPGLQYFEKKGFFSFGILSLLFISIGVSFSYFFTIPFANAFFLNWNKELGDNLWSLSHYLEYSILLILSNAVAFESLAILFTCVQRGWISSQTLKDKRRFVILGVFIASAILTPPDVLTQCLLAIPLLLLYECAIIYSNWKEKNRPLANRNIN